jgi:peptidoglycan-associated lipoprotein
MSIRSTVGTFVAVGLLAVGLFGSGCKPNYPKCKKDEHCKQSEQGQKEGKLYCVNGLCQECRTDDHCGGPGMRCENGECTEIPNYCEGDGDCSGDQVCRDNRCGPECLSDEDCGEGETCKGGSCEPEDECSTDADCEGDKVCRNGSCVEPRDTASTCSLKSVYFAFDSSSLSSTARNKLEDNADCIKDRGRSVKIAGHCDERGSNEYNVALGERRASSVSDYLTKMGVSSGDVSTISYGEERLARQCGVDASDSCHEENRRVELSWQ